MKQKSLNYLLLFVVLFSMINSSHISNKRLIRKSIGRTWRGAYKKASALTATLILKRLGDGNSIEKINEKIRAICVHLRFLGRKLYKNFKVTKKLIKNKQKRRRFSVRFVKFILKSLLSCEVVRKSNKAYKIKSALRNASKAKHDKIVRKVLELAKSFRGPIFKFKRRHRSGYARFAKKGKKTKKKNKKNAKKAIKNLKKLKSLKAKLLKAQEACRNKKFKRNSSACKKARKLRRKYKRRAAKTKKVLYNSCRKHKRRCFKYNIGCKKMFKICKKSGKVVEGLKNQKALHFARVFVSIIKHLNK